MNKNTQIKQLEESNAKMKADIEAQAKMIAELTVSKKRERVARGETYWHLTTSNLVNSDIDDNDIIDLNRFKCGNYYYSEEEAQLASEKAFAQQRIFDALREHEGDWELALIVGHHNAYISYGHKGEYFETCNSNFVQRMSDTRWYSSGKSCRWVINNMEDDLKICFGVV